MSASAETLKNTISLARFSKLKRSHSQYTPQQLLIRKTRGIIAKTTHSNKASIFAKMQTIYSQIDNIGDLKGFVDVILHQASNHYQCRDLYIDIMSKLNLSTNNKISQLQFKQCISTLCDEYFNKLLIFPNRTDYFNQELYEFELEKHKKSFAGIASCIGKCINTENRLINIIELEKYFKHLFQPKQDEKFDEDKLYIAYLIFWEISRFLKLKSKIIKNDYIKVKNVKMDSIEVDRKSHLLTHGYIRNNFDNDKDNKYDIPLSIKNFCVGYYDANWELSVCWKYYEKLQTIVETRTDSMPSYSMRIRLIINNLIQYCQQ